MVENPLFVALIAIVTAVIASSGFWAYIDRKGGRNRAQTKLLIGVTQGLIVYLGALYLDRGSITKDEYDTLIEKLYKPYLELGGNGLVEKVVQDVKTLPIQNDEGEK